MILPINYVVDWRYNRQNKQTQINRYVTRENTTRINHDYRVGDKVMTKNRSAYKYKTPFRGRMQIFERGQMVPSPYERLQLHIE